MLEFSNDISLRFGITNLILHCLCQKILYAPTLVFTYNTKKQVGPLLLILNHVLKKQIGSSHFITAQVKLPRAYCRITIDQSRKYSYIKEEYLLKI